MACLHLLRDRLSCAIYVDTGFAYPETMAMIDYAATLLTVHRIKTDRQAQNARHGLPADVVPIEWTRLGQETTCTKPMMIQSYIGCCYENIALPLWWAAKNLGVTELIYGQRRSDSHRATIVDRTNLEGIKRVHPIEDWSDEDVLCYLATKMDIPLHYRFRHSSLDCYDCTAYQNESNDRVQWMKRVYPQFYAAYEHRAQWIVKALENPYG